MRGLLRPCLRPFLHRGCVQLPTGLVEWPVLRRPLGDEGVWFSSFCRLSSDDLIEDHPDGLAYATMRSISSLSSASAVDSALAATSPEDGILANHHQTAAMGFFSAWCI